MANLPEHQLFATIRNAFKEVITYLINLGLPLTSILNALNAPEKDSEAITAEQTAASSSVREIVQPQEKPNQDSILAPSEFQDLSLEAKQQYLENILTILRNGNFDYFIQFIQKAEFDPNTTQCNFLENKPELESYIKLLQRILEEKIFSSFPNLEDIKTYIHNYYTPWQYPEDSDDPFAPVFSHLKNLPALAQALKQHGEKSLSHISRASYLYPNITALLQLSDTELQTLLKKTLRPSGEALPFFTDLNNGLDLYLASLAIKTPALPKR